MEDDKAPSTSEPVFKEPSPKKPKRPAQDLPEDQQQPKKAQLKHESEFLRSIPSSSQYEKSFMHRDTISHVIATKTDFIITASVDGHLKFWKKKHSEGVEFVKHFRCHLSEFSHICANIDGTLLATVCEADKSVKVFDIENFDMINMIKLDFPPKTAMWVHQSNDPTAHLAIGAADSGKVIVVDGKASATPICVKDKLHSTPVRAIEYSQSLDMIVSIDESGIIECWSGDRGDFEFPQSKLSWEYKLETDLYDFVKAKTIPVCAAFDPSGIKLATFAEDRKVRVFNVKTGKLIVTIDETTHRYQIEAKENKNYGLQHMEWSRRLAAEKEMDKDKKNSLKYSKLCFDESGNFLLYPTPIGVKVYNLYTKEVSRTIGRDESIRFVAVSLCNALPDIRSKLQGAAITLETAAADNPTLNKKTDPDPLMVCCALRKNRFYLFTNTEPFNVEDDEGNPSVSGRDVFNERPKKEDLLTALDTEGGEKVLNKEAVIHTSFGDITIRLFGDECPKTVENFCTHSRRGYYNGLTFHRVIKSFMIQTGDPTGKGTGGESIWGEDFEDEFHPRLRHDKPFKVSMANAGGGNTNGSQFFITVCPADWLDGKNTLFGEVTAGMSVVQRVNQVPTFERSGRPRETIQIMSISLK
ncbi:Protein CBR-CYN-15 [Caenorhabditis briggsae]|uniref:peptidylprolyl isomerase n=1 Tax=Caenorhabditis briggsae TaxID=6238 RepID=A8X5M9_CAEBR|nr:Protein CBR-CYN-15 [Caenorhabditis briggsae]CAP27940.2 Protein CBR-CYN-15 [Caenorhabditis briggsae]